jgi:uncharacterized protein (DUF2141 family)
MIGSLAAAAMAAVSLSGEGAAADGQCTGPPSAVRLYVNVVNVRSSKGLMAVTLYADDSKRFLARRGSLYVGRAPAHQGTTRVCIYLPSTGTYGIVVYHDADANRKFNRNFMGMPQEGFGFSNNPNTFLGIPSFRSVRMNVPRSGIQVTVRLRYP